MADKNWGDAFFSIKKKLRKFLGDFFMRGGTYLEISNGDAFNVFVPRTVISSYSVSHHNKDLEIWIVFAVC